MIEVLKQLRVLHVQSGKSQQTVAENIGYSKSTISNILSGKSEDVRLQTVIDLAAEYGAEVALITEQSNKAITQQDVTYYRDQLADRDSTIVELREKTAKQEELIDTLRTNNITMRNNVNGELDRVRAEFEEDIKFYREQVLFAQQQLAFAQSQIAKKDEYIHVLMETAKKGGDLKSLEPKLSEDK